MADHASGSYVWTTDGRRHLDFASGIGAALSSDVFSFLLPLIRSIGFVGMAAQAAAMPAALPAL